MTDEKKIRRLAELDLTILLHDTATPFESLSEQTKENWIGIWVRGYKDCDKSWHEALNKSTVIV